MKARKEVPASWIPLEDCHLALWPIEVPKTLLRCGGGTFVEIRVQANRLIKAMPSYLAGTLRVRCPITSLSPQGANRLTRCNRFRRGPLYLDRATLLTNARPSGPRDAGYALQLS